MKQAPVGRQKLKRSSLSTSPSFKADACAGTDLVSNVPAGKRHSLPAMTHPTLNDTRLGTTSVLVGEDDRGVALIGPRSPVSLDADPMPLVRVNFKSLSDLVENGFSERNHRIYGLQSQNESLRSEISNASNEIERLTEENANMKCEIDRVTLENERLKIVIENESEIIKMENERLKMEIYCLRGGIEPPNTALNAGAITAGQNDDRNQVDNGSTPGVENKAGNEGEMTAKDWKTSLKGLDKTFSGLDKKLKEVTRKHEKATKRIQELKRSQDYVIEELRKIADTPNPKRWASPRPLIGLVRNRIAKLQHRIKNEANRPNATITHLKSQVAKLKSDMSAQRKTLKNDVQAMESKVETCKKQLKRVIQVAANDENNTSGGSSKILPPTIDRNVANAPLPNAVSDPPHPVPATNGGKKKKKKKKTSGDQNKDLNVVKVIKKT